MTRKNSIIFTIIFFVTILGFVVVIGFIEFQDKNGGDLEDMLAKGAGNSNSSLTNNHSPAAKFPSASAPSGAAPTAQPPMSNNSNLAPDTETAPQDLPANTAPLNAGSSAPDTTNTVTKTFTEDKLGISFDYPSEYVVSEKNNQVAATKSKIAWKLKVYDNKDKKEIPDWFTGNYSDGNDAGCALGDPSTLKLGSYTTKTMKASSADAQCDDGGYFALNTDKSKIVRVILDKGTEDDANKILSTFKFLN